MTSRTLTGRTRTDAVEISVPEAATADLRARYRSAGWWSAKPIDVIAEAALLYSEKTALVTESESLNYEDLDAEVTRVARALIETGVEASDRVLVVAGNDAASLIALHALWRIGALAMVMLPSAGDGQLSDIVEDMQPKLAVEPAGWQHPEALAKATLWCEAESLRSLDSESFEDSSGAPRLMPRDPDSPAVVIFTSGTTARPKGVVHSMNTLVASGRNLIEATEFGEGEGLFVVSPLGTVTGLLHALIVPPLLGSSTVLVRAWQPSSALDLLLETKAALFGGPDVLLERILDEARRRDLVDLPLQCVIVGGSMNHKELLERAEAEFAITVLRSYGSSEAPVACATKRSEPRTSRLSDEGVPLGGVEVQIGSPDESSECWLRGPNLFLGYVDPAATSASVQEGWFRTGDQAEFLDGRLRVFGRLKDVVIRNGLKVPIGEVDELIASLPGVVEAAGFVRQDENTGERLAVALRLAPGTDVTLEGIADHLGSLGLAKWKLPEEIVLWTEPLPETASGKIQRSALAERVGTFERLLAPRLAEG